MIIFYLIGSLIIYSISMNNFFFDILEEPLAKLFDTNPGPDFRKVADPVQLWLTAIILFFIGSVKKMNALKGKLCFMSQFLIFEAFTKVSLIMIFYMAVMAII